MKEKKMKNKYPKMTFKNLAEMKEYMKYWQHVLCLEHWFIEPRLVDELKDADGEDCWGLNNNEQVNRVATVSVRKFRPGEDDQSPKKYCAEQILVHELLHCDYNWLQKDYKDHAAAFYDVKDHQQLELMAEAFILAKYNLKRDFFYNKKD
jgi:hypothetical protein